MKRLIMCEGPNELTLINILLENWDWLPTTRDRSKRMHRYGWR